MTIARTALDNKRLADTPDPVRADPDDEPDLTPEQEAELQADFDKWIKVRADPVREELLAALSSAEQRFRTIAMGSTGDNWPTRELMRANLDIAFVGESSCRAAISRAESTAPALAPVQADQKEWRVTNGGAFIECISEFDADQHLKSMGAPADEVYKQWRTKAGEWQDAEKEQA